MSTKDLSHSPFEPSLKRLSISSRHSLNQTQGLVPLSATDTILKRFQGWSTIVKNLIKFFELVVEQEKRSCESKLKAGKELQLDNPSLHLFEEQETFQVSFYFSKLNRYYPPEYKLNNFIFFKKKIAIVQRTRRHSI